jgi:hypothetical protein
MLLSGPRTAAIKQPVADMDTNDLRENIIRMMRKIGKGV